MASFQSRTMKIMAAATNTAMSSGENKELLLMPLENTSPLLILDIPEITQHIEIDQNIVHLDIPLANSINICDPIDMQLNNNKEGSQRCEGLMIVDKENDYQSCCNMQDILEIPSSSKEIRNDLDDQSTTEENNKYDNPDAGELSNNNKSDSDNNSLSNNENENNEPKKKRKKKHLVSKNTWKQKVNEINREKGKNYNGRKKINGVWTEIAKPGRSLGPRCECKLSKLTNKTKTSLECQKLGEDDRQEIFKMFWEQMNWEQRKTFVYLSVKNAPTKRHRNRKEENKSRREYSSEYNLKKRDDSTIRVCKKMYLNTIAMGERMVDIWKFSGCNERNLKSIKNASNDESVNNQDEQHRTNKEKFAQEKKNLQEFFENLPKVESHYCRASSNRHGSQNPLFTNVIETFGARKRA